jgi:hypothetical protein
MYELSHVAETTYYDLFSKFVHHCQRQELIRGCCSQPSVGFVLLFQLCKTEVGLVT